MRKRKRIVIKKMKVLKDKKGVYMGETDKNTGKIKINMSHKAHKDKRELASTVKHELMHALHPMMKEKTVYKRTAKSKISLSEQKRLLAKLK